jgi:cobalt-zinc-cadmium resistance protein CzcA
MVEVLVDLKPLSEWRPNVTKEELIARMEKSLDDMPGIKPSFSQPIRDNVLESISQIDGQIVIKIFGDDSSVLKQKIDELLHLIEPIQGVGRAFCGPRWPHSSNYRSKSIGSVPPGTD